METRPFIHQKLQSKYFEYPVNVFALDHYKRDCAGEHEFSRKQVWFYVYGDEELKNEFKGEFSQLFEQVIDGGNWDFAALVPTHVKGQLNENMEDLVRDVTSNVGIDYNNVLERTETVNDNHNLDTFREKAINLEGSIDITEDVEGKNIILVDNIALTGCSFMHAAELLKEAGAENIICLTLGIKPRDEEKMLEESSEINLEIRS